MITACEFAFVAISDIWQLYLGPVQQLVDNLTYVERTLIAMSQSSVGNMLRMASIVQNIVSESTTALTMARNARNVSTINALLALVSMCIYSLGWDSG